MFVKSKKVLALYVNHINMVAGKGGANFNYFIHFICSVAYEYHLLGAEVSIFIHLCLN